LKEGAYADIVVLDPIQIRNNATYKNPMIPPSGIKYVIVNGTLAYSKGALTTGAGKVLKNVHDV
jgi:N-acyl-D-aspartate/D-glutamate deacylase